VPLGDAMQNRPGGVEVTGAGQGHRKDCLVGLELRIRLVDGADERYQFTDATLVETNTVPPPR
jgi:hypothetical protein